jgi:hypothetical protein
MWRDAAGTQETRKGDLRGLGSHRDGEMERREIARWIDGEIERSSEIL